jgi:hypothetical protein
LPLVLEIKIILGHTFDNRVILSQINRLDSQMNESVTILVPISCSASASQLHTICMALTVNNWISKRRIMLCGKAPI